MRDLYRTETVLRRQLRVRYPLTEGRIVLRTDLDWDRDLEAASVTDEGTTFTFELDETLQAAGVEMCFAEMKGPATDRLKRFGLVARFGERMFFATLEEAVSSYLAAGSVDRQR